MSECMHEHVGFGDSGRTITCIDCSRRWQLQGMNGMPDMTYMNTSLAAMGHTRHGMFTVPRTKPLPPPPVVKAKK